MKEYTQGMVVVLLAFSILTLCLSHYENTKSAQEIENLETLYRIKENLDTRRALEETDEWIKITERKINESSTTVF